MGTNTSKVNNGTAVNLEKNEVDGSSDPRSPTPEISRTPLQGKAAGQGAKHNITKNVDLRKTFENTHGEEKLIHNNPILSAVIKNHLQSYDPRSPTQDFERTPIVIGSKLEGTDDTDIRQKSEGNYGSPCLKNETFENIDGCEEVLELCSDIVVPKNLCNGFFDMTLNDTLKENEEPLGSSTASNEAIESNMSNETESKPTQLLETNFDFVDTKDENCSQMKKNAANALIFKILNGDPRSPSIGIERTPIVVSKHEEDTSEDNVEDMSDDTLIKVLQNTNAELRQNGTKSGEKNEGLLIYEDESNTLDDTPKKPKSSNGTNSGSRTPLSCVKNKGDTSHTRSKSANTLHESVSQKIAHAKAQRRVSHIPRLKSLTKPVNLAEIGSSVSLKNLSKTSGVIGGDCENTPPHSHRDIWDKNNSIVL